MDFYSIFRRKSISDVLSGLSDEERQLKRILGPGNLILIGIGIIIGAGIFASIGTAVVGDDLRPGAGPAIVVSFILTGIACGFAALCYAEFASTVPISGSAYTYTYTTFGEVIAWTVGWDLLFEYAVSAVAVAISCSGYFNELLFHLGIQIPAWLTIDYRTAIHGDNIYRVTEMIKSGIPVDSITGQPAAVESVRKFLADNKSFDAILSSFYHGHAAVIGAPKISGIPIIFNLPAMGIVVLITVLLIRGIRESTVSNAFMVSIKLLVLTLFVIVGIFYIDTKNYTPFAPNGWRGIQSGAAIVFFAYLGFDSVSTLAEETKKPERNMPIGIVGSLLICTLIYIIVSAVLIGMVPLGVFTQENKAEPFTVALNLHNLNWFSGIVAVGAVIATTCVLLVMLIAQPRIFFSMSRDGLLPKSFSSVHPRFRTPYITTIITGLLVAFFAAFTNIDEVVDLANIGTLFAFILVSMGIIILRYREPERKRPFRVPFMPWVPILAIASCIYLAMGLPAVTWLRFFIWLTLGLIVYVAYGSRKSKLRVAKQGNLPNNSGG